MVISSNGVHFISGASLVAAPARKLCPGLRMRNLFLVGVLFVLASPCFAQVAPPSADYVCAYGCRQTDANPRLEIQGTVARCWNEFGGVYVGEFNPPDSVSCFRKTGRIISGGARIEWSDGVLWRRR